jgi:hypothetical protein
VRPRLVDHECSAAHAEVLTGVTRAVAASYPLVASAWALAAASASRSAWRAATCAAATRPRASASAFCATGSCALALAKSAAACWARSVAASRVDWVRARSASTRLLSSPDWALAGAAPPSAVASMTASTRAVVPRRLERVVSTVTLQ